jgi:hypothetical protein
MTTPNRSRAHGDTLNEILRLEAELLAAERQACRNLADTDRDMRGVLPDEDEEA